MPKPVKPQAEKSWFSVVHNQAEKRVLVSIHGYIGMYDITAANLMSQVNGLEDIDVIEAHINSYGGEVFEGVAIYNWLRAHKARVDTVIDSIAASISSLIFLAGGKRTVYDTSMGMVHMPITMSYGNAKHLRKDADDLDKIDQGTIRKAYKKAVGDKLSDAEIDELMENETWLDSDELLEYGFATDKAESNDDDEVVDNKYRQAAVGFDMATLGFKAMPARMLNAISNTIPSVLSGKLNTITNSAPQGPQKNQQEGAMPIDPKAGNQPDNSVAAQAEIEKVRNDAAVAERNRVTGIQSLAAAMNVTGEIVSKMITDNKQLGEALAEFTAAKALAAQQPENPQNVPPQSADPNIQMGLDDADKFRKGATLALCLAAGDKIDPKDAEDVRRSGMPNSVHGLLAETLIRAGKNPHRVARMNSVDLAHDALRIARNAGSVGTGDLTNVLADTINKKLGDGYTIFPGTWQRFAVVTPVSDFKNYSAVKISGFGDMDTIPEGFPFRQGGVSDTKEQGAVTVKGRSCVVTMQALVNDDLSALTRIPQSMGSSMAYSQNKAFYDYLFGSAAVGPTLLEADSNGGYGAFTSYRANFATGAGAPSTSTLNTARAAMMNQSGIKGQADDTAKRMGLIPSYLITGTTQMTTVEQLLLTRTIVMPSDPSKAVDTYNPFGQGGSTPLEPIFDAYLDYLSTTVWYLATKPQVYGHMQMLALNGQIAPTVRSEDSHVGEALGISYDVYGAWAPFMEDFRGMYCHKGA